MDVFPLILSIYLRVNYMETMLNILREWRTVFQSGCAIYILTSSVGEGSSFSTSLPTLVIYLIDYNHPVDIKWYLILWWLMILSIFSCAYWAFVYLLWRSSCSGSLYVFNHRSAGIELNKGLRLIWKIAASISPLPYLVLICQKKYSKWFSWIFFPANFLGCSYYFSR